MQSITYLQAIVPHGDMSAYNITMYVIKHKGDFSFVPTHRVIMVSRMRPVRK